jgi:hypothetical protein
VHRKRRFPIGKILVEGEGVAGESSSSRHLEGDCYSHFGTRGFRTVSAGPCFDGKDGKDEFLEVLLEEDQKMTFDGKDEFLEVLEEEDQRTTFDRKDGEAELLEDLEEEERKEP